MKKENRVRAKSSPAQVAAQTKTLSKKAGDWPLIAAREIVAKFYNERRQMKYHKAFSDLGKLSYAIAHHLELKTISVALRQLDDCECTINMFHGENYAIEQLGAPSMPKEEFSGRSWFLNYYRAIEELTYLEGITNYEGLLPWIKGNQQFAEIAQAIEKIVSADNVLNAFFEAVRAEEVK
jgi:hypothetical protein